MPKAKSQVSQNAAQKIQDMKDSDLTVCNDFTSSTIKSLAYNAKKKVLYVEFKSEALYEYSKVPMDEYINLTKATSVGQYFNAHIKDEFEYEKLK